MMKDRFTQNEDHKKDFEEQLKSIAEHTDTSQPFRSELEQRLMSAHQARFNSSASFFKGALPMLSWTLGLALLALFLNWAIQGIVRTPPEPAANITITPVVEMTITPESIDQVSTPTGDDGYDWRGTKLYLALHLPDSQAQANVYQLKKDQQITAEEARALASRFGLQGEMYTAYDYLFSVNDYYFTDGKQALEVYSNRRFNYTADLAKARTLFQSALTDDAERIIREFLNARGFDFPFKIAPSDFFNGYSLEPLAPDGLTIQYESFTYPPMLIRLDENGEVLNIDATLVDYESTPLGTYGIISAQEALDILLNDNEQGGKLDFFHSVSNQGLKEWFRTHPDNQTITVFGFVSSNPSIDSSKPPFITIDGVPAFGNTTGLEQVEQFSFIEASGQYLVENGIRKFQVDSWTSNIEPVYITAMVQREGDQIILTISDAGTDHQAPLIGSGKQYPLINPPADLPLDNKPDSQLSVQGVLVNGSIDWYYIQYFENMSESGGGGGSGGLGFYQLNLSGTPIPFPTPTVQPEINQGSLEHTVQEGDTVLKIAELYGLTPEKILQANPWLDGGVLAPGQTLIIPGLENSTEQRVENMRGFLSISIHKSEDGSQLTSYLVAVPDPTTQTFYELEGSNLSELDQFNGLPILVSGTVRREAFIPTLSLESYEIPFPDLQFQVLNGTQQVQEIDGQLVTLFTTETGQTYVEFLINTGQLNFSIIGTEGDLIQQEVLIVPDETFASYPVIRVYSAGLVISPKDGQPMELPITANQIPVYDAAASPEVPNTTPPSLTIDSIELEYFVNNPYYQVDDPNYERRSTYIQPVWHFRGHYENGNGFDMMVQALKREFLSPQLSPGISPG